jgi:hypothetical protein
MAEEITNAHHEGYLTKQGFRIKTWRKRWCVLAGGTLSYYKSKNKASIIPLY